MTDTPTPPAQPPRRRALLVGLGLDGADGHTRVTAGENFCLLGGSRETHERMQEGCIKFNEELKRRVKRLEHLSRREFLEIAAQAKLLDGGAR